ncbi:MAG TPA: Fic family protein [Candidatus Pacearchaeota archaeon]|nr:Fic family protein [Candidatus Pacearchaeota archaeon]
MCMNIDKKELLRINKGFGGNLRSDSSLDYALEKFENKRLGFYKKLAYLWRAILVDHPFSDGNKRTAAYAALSLASESNKKVDTELLMHHIVSVAKQNIHDIKNIEWRLRNAIR